MSEHDVMSSPISSGTAHAPLLEFDRGSSAEMTHSTATSQSTLQMFQTTNRARDGAKGVADIKNPWEAAMWGGVAYMVPHTPQDGTVDASSLHASELPEGHKLNELQATSIAGNDITSSCLYSSGLVLQASGRVAPLCITLVALVLYLFRAVYAEVGSALPLNGGTYNALLNTTNKSFASVAACLTVLSYTATAVVSAASAAGYVQVMFPDANAAAVAIGILAIFALLTYMGITDSANVASVIFICNLLTLTAVLLAAVVFCLRDGFQIFRLSFSDDTAVGSPNANVALDIFFGFGTAMLGVTGFESSSNYIEEQQEGVFPKTLRNMWATVLVFNPLLCVFIMGVVPLPTIVSSDDYANSVLAHVAELSGGNPLRIILVVDAIVVLSGSVLTAYVGIVGLMRRLALDRCLPHFLLRTNSWRGTNHYIILVFFLVTASLRLLVSDMVTLGGVYGIAFLSVMSMFTVANILLKYKRNKLPRTPIASYPHAIIALLFVVTGLMANVMKSSRILSFFMLYASVTLLVVLGMFSRVQVLRFLAQIHACLPTRAIVWIKKTIFEVRSLPLIFFAKTPTLSVMNKAVLYVLDNEDTNCVRIVHCFKNREEDAATLREFEESWAVLDKLYPKLTVELYLVEGEFGPEMVHRLSAELNVPKNFMFMTCPGNKFPHHIGRFGGIRVIHR